MPEIQVTLTGFEVKPGESANGPYVLTKFTADDGKKYQTFDEELAAKLKSKIGQGTFGLEFEVQSRTNNGKTFTNNVATGLAGAATIDASGAGTSSGTLERLAAFEAGLRLTEVVAPENLNFVTVTTAAESILAWAKGELAGSDPEDAVPDADPSDAVPD